MHYDFLVLGQGIAGTLLSYELKKRGRRVLVVADEAAPAASKAAGGVLNPVNGKALWQTRKQEKLLPVAIHKYRELEADWQLPLLTEMPLLHFHTEERLRLYFEARSREIPELLQVLKPEDAAGWRSFFHVENGIGAVKHCYVIAARQLLQHCRMQLSREGALLEANWDWPALRLSAEGVAYKGFTASVLICCEGAAGRQNPFFGALPFTRNKGEALLVRIPGLPREFMYQHGLRLTPWRNEADVFWLGSNQVWDYEQPAPDRAWREAAVLQLKDWLKTDFEVLEHLCAERPTTAGQTIFAGAHPRHRQIALLNGLGTRGFLAGPYYAAQLARQLCGEEELEVITHKSLRC